MKLHWNSIQLAMLAFGLVFAMGCSGINASQGVSPATFLMPGIGQIPAAAPHSADPASAVISES